MSALNVSSVSSPGSDHVLIKYELSLACPCDTGTNVFITRHIGLATLTALIEKLPMALAPFTIVSEPLENFTNDLNSTLTTLRDYVAPASTKNR